MAGYQVPLPRFCMWCGKDFGAHAADQAATEKFRRLAREHHEVEHPVEHAAALRELMDM